MNEYENTCTVGLNRWTDYATAINPAEFQRLLGIKQDKNYSAGQMLLIHTVMQYMYIKTVYTIPLPNDFRKWSYPAIDYI